MHEFGDVKRHRVQPLRRGIPATSSYAVRFQPTGRVIRPSSARAAGVERRRSNQPEPRFVDAHPGRQQRRCPRERLTRVGKGGVENSNVGWQGVEDPVARLQPIQ